MRVSETHRLEAGTIISVWPASAGGGIEKNIRLPRPYVVPQTGRYLIETDTVENTVTFRFIPGEPASEEHVESVFEALEGRGRRRRS